MSLRASTLVWQSSRASGSDLVMLLAIADFANDAGSAFPSVATLAKKARMQERNARYVLGRLVESGELQVELNAGPKGCNVFRIAIDQPLQSSAPLQPAAALQVVAALQSSAPLQPASVTPAGACTKPLQRIAPEPSLNRQEPSLKLSSGKPDLSSSSRLVLDYLNARAGRAYRSVPATLAPIHVRLESGVSVEQCRQVIDAKVAEWGADPAMEKYLRPATLFRASNFEQYLGALGVSKSGSNVPEWTRRGFGSAIEMQQAQEAA